MAGVFISYASQTRPVAQRVADQLRALGHEVWWDDELLPHRPFAEVIEERLAQASAVLVVWSEAAVHSQWVRAEADFAMKAGKLVQAAVGGVLPPMPFNQIQCEDLAHWSGDPADPHWRKVAAGVAALTGAPGVPSAISAASTSGAGRRWARGPFRRPPVWAMAVGLAALLLAGGGIWAFLNGGGAFGGGGAGQRVAILPFDTLGSDPSLRVFADGLQDETLSVLASNGTATLSKADSQALKGPDAAASARRMGVGLVLDGTVEAGAGGAIKVRVHLDDMASHAVLWSKDFDGQSADTDPLEAEVAARSAAITAAALAALKAGVSDPSTVSDYVSVKENTVFVAAGGLERAETVARRVTAAAPNFADAHGSLAMVLAIEGRDAASDRAAAMKAEAKTEADRALALDPHQGAAYVALILMRPNTDWAGRADLLAKGLAADQTLGMLPLLEARLLGQSGRLNAAIDRARQAVALDPLQPWANQTLAVLLAGNGQPVDAAAVFTDMSHKWPDGDAVRFPRFWMAAASGDAASALALLNGPTPPVHATAPLWRQALLAEQSGGAADKAAAAKAIEQAVKAGAFESGTGLVVLAQLGDIDGAVAAANQYAAEFNGEYTADPPYLFSAAAKPLRRDPRFMAVAAKIGLTAYWRATGQWPDFCADPTLPYNCAAEAAKAAAAG